MASKFGISFALQVFYAITVPPPVVADEDKVAMDTVPFLPSRKVAQRVTAVIDLFRGVPLPQVTAQSEICRSDLYKFRRRALTALHQALEDHPRGPKRPHNRLTRNTEQRIISLC